MMTESKMHSFVETIYPDEKCLASLQEDFGLPLFQLVLG